MFTVRDPKRFCEFKDERCLTDPWRTRQKKGGEEKVFPSGPSESRLVTDEISGLPKIRKQSPEAFESLRTWWRGQGEAGGFEKPLGEGNPMPLSLPLLGHPSPPSQFLPKGIKLAHKIDEEGGVRRFLLSVLRAEGAGQTGSCRSNKNLH